MKKILIFVFLLCIPLVSSLSLNINPEYSQGETIISELSGNVLSQIDNSQVELRRGHVQVPFDYEIRKLGDSYFLYGIAPFSENNYTLIIKDIETTINGQRRKVDLESNFSTTNNLIVYSIKPGFILTDGDFDLTITSYEDVDLEIETGFPTRESLLLNPGENEFSFSKSSLPEGLSSVQVGIYNLPVYLLNSDSNPPINSSRRFTFFPERIESTILRSSNEKYPFKFANLGESTISNIVFIYNEDLFRITPEPYDAFAPDELYEFNLEILDYSKDIDEVIIARSGDFEVNFPVIISFTEDESQVDTPYLNGYNESSGYLCSELGGTFCSAEESCSGNVVSSLDGNSCCIGTCQKKETSGGSLAWVGWLIAAIILIVGVIILGRYMKTRKSGSSSILNLKKS